MKTNDNFWYIFAFVVWIIVAIIAIKEPTYHRDSNPNLDMDYIP